MNEEEIRLLIVHPGSPEDIVITSLVTVNLANCPPYEALSYVWGDYQQRASVKIDGYPIEIHAELFNAIHTLRNPDSPRLIWADAICIDQSNSPEKSHQVHIVGRIYETAENVVVYLGKPSDRSEEAMQYLNFFTNPSNVSEEPPWSYSELSMAEQNLADILSRPWFERIWKVQEATLARHTTLVCGEHRVSWHVDLQTMRSIVFKIKAAAISPYFSPNASYPSTLDWSPLLDILETQMRQAARREGVTLRRNHLDLAFDFRHRKCTERRDKYFAIFGIIENDQGGQLALVPDYTIGLEELHDRFTAETRRISESTSATAMLAPT